MARPINQKEYLKRYLSAETDSNKKKLRKKVKTSVKVTRTFCIVDDDVDIKALAPAPEKQDDLNNPLIDDEIPLIAEVIDERPKDEVILEQYRTSKKWKTMDDEGGDVTVPRHQRRSPASAKGRRTRHDSSNSDPSPPRKVPQGKASYRRDSDSDVSLPRRKGAASDPDPSPPRKRRPESPPAPSRRQVGGRGKPPNSSTDSDFSPARDAASTSRSGRRSRERENHGRSKSDARTKDRKTAPRLTPPRKSSRHDSSSDSDSYTSQGRSRARESVSGQRRTNSDSNVSPVRRREATRVTSDKSGHGRHDSDSDLSPPRRAKGTSVGRPPARVTRHDSDSDLSPPRRAKDKRGDARGNRTSARGARHDSDSDLSPPRRAPSGKSSHRVASPTGSNSDSDLSPTRQQRRQDSDADLSPVRRSSQGREQKWKRQEASRPPRQRESGPEGTRSRDDRGGKHRPVKTLSGTTAGLSDAKAMRQENVEFRRRDAQMYSTMADDVSGRNAKTVFRDKKSGRTRDLDSEKRQKREEEAQKAEEDEKFVEWGKGVAQNTQRKALVQDALLEVDKPLARYQDDKDLDEMLRQQEKEGDPMLEFLRNKRAKNQAALGVKAKPKYMGRPAPPNRFNLMPGYRWDGVDRSNGFEKKAFVRQADKKAMKEIAYKWSIEDM